MTDAILCSPHFDSGKAVLGLRIETMMTVIYPDGHKEELTGIEDLCEKTHAQPYMPLIERLRAAGAPTVIPGRVEPPSAPAADPPKAITPAPEPAPAPAPPQPVATQKPGIFRCLEKDCGDEVQYRTRGGHSHHIHGKKAWDVSWAPLFDVSGWHECTCGYIIGTESGMKQHPKAAGSGHFPKAEPYHWTAADMETPVGAAFARAIGK